MKKILLVLSVFAFTFSNAQDTTFNYTGNLDSLQIPACVDSIIIEVHGAQGADAFAGGVGGNGAYASGRIPVSTGDWIYIQVGGMDGYNGGGTGGVNGWISSGVMDLNSGGNGGGATDVRVGGTTLNDRIIVAGGGGGGGHDGVWSGCQPADSGGDGGAGGAADGTGGGSTACNCAGSGGTPGMAGTPSAGGTGGGDNGGVCGGGFTAFGADGILGIGGDGSINFYNGTGGGGGGGGGYYGGGSAGSGWDTTPGGGGGGGSSYVGGVSMTTETQGTNTGDGMVEITYIACPSGAGISQEEMAKMNIYPNPVHNELTIEWLEQNGQSHFELTNIQGKVVMTVESSEALVEMNIETLPNGVYVLKVVSENGKLYQRKIIKE